MSEKVLTLQDIQEFKGKYPKQLWALFFSEMWERFCFYGMRGMLVFFMINELMLSDKNAQLQYGAIQAFIYAFTFVGGLFADKVLGFRRSLFWGGLLMIAGSIILAINPHTHFFLGISFTVVGTGFFKPNISAMVGWLYKKEDTRRDAGFSLFYAGINLGAFLGGYACVAIGKGYMLSSYIPEGLRWNMAFGLAAIVMAISLVTFVFTKRSLGPIGISPLHEFDKKKRHIYEVVVYIIALACIPLIMQMVINNEYTNYFMYTVGPLTLLYLIFEMRRHTKEEVKKLLAALVFIFFSILFFAFFEQGGGSLSVVAANNVSDKALFGLLTLDPNGVNNAANAFFVIIFAALVGLLWVALAKKKLEPNTVVKFGLGFLFLGIAFYILYLLRYFANSEGISSLDVFIWAYFVMTLGELCLSPIGLSIMTKLSPARLQGIMMGMWFLASAYGQYVAGILGASMTSPDKNASNFDKLMAFTSGYQQVAYWSIGAGVLLVLISPLVRKLMQEVK
ncbi:peptide MFS transporter [Capnocytophaga haemolytica]